MSGTTQVTIIDAALTKNGLPADSVQPQPAEVFYFGSDYEHFSRLRRDAPPGLAPRSTGPRLNAIARATLDDYRNIDAHLVDDVDRDLWDATDLAERSHFNSDFHYRACCVLLFIECLRSPGVRLFVVEDALLARRLAQRARHEGAQVRHLREPPARRVGNRLYRQLHTRWHAACRSLQRVRALRHARREHPVPTKALRECDLLMVLWGSPTTFATEGRVTRDDYFGELPGLLRGLGLRPGFLVLPIDWVYPYADIAASAVRSAEPVLVLQDLLRVSDIVRIAWRVTRFMFRARPLVVIGGVELTVEARDALLDESTRPRIDETMLLQRAGPGLAALGIRPRRIVHLYENQSWEKCLRRGVRESLSATGLVGCMHQPASDLFVSFLPTRRELARDDLPDHIAVPGPFFRERLCAAGVPRGRVCVGGAVRPPGGAGSTPLVPRSLADGGVCCLVATGIDYQSALELLDKAIRAARLEARLELLVNFHPRVRSEFVARLRSELQGLHGESVFAHVEFAEGSVASLLPRAQVMLYNVTAAALEAVAAGVRTIFVAPDLGLALDKVPDGLSLQATTAAEIAAAATAATASTVSDPSVTGATVDACFRPLDPHAWNHMTADAASPSSNSSPGLRAREAQ